MAISLKTASKLCTTAELALVEATRRGKLEELKPAQLKQKIARTRKMLSKWRDAEKKQGRSARGRGKARKAPPASGNENTSRKRALFEEVLRRFETRLSKLGAASKTKISSVADKRSGRPKGVRRKSPKAAKAKASAGKASKAKPAKRAGKKAAGKLARLADAGTQRTLGHLSSRNKRSQGKRDARTARGRGG